MIKFRQEKLMDKRSTNKAGKSGIILVLTVIALWIGQRFSFSEDPTIINNPPPQGVIKVHFIDVGQGDSILIENGEAAMLIDAGENSQGEVVVNYINSLDIEDLDYVIGTHPHSDHIGGLDDVILQVPVEKIIFPDVVHTTKTFEDVLDAIESKNLKITKAIPGDEYTLGEAEFTIVAPNSIKYDELNNYSVGIHLQFGDSSFLFIGDAEELSEEEILEAGHDISADVFKLSHHGSSTSNSSKFLDQVNPAYAVITVGEGNSYGHPHSITMQAMQERNIKVYRTDKQGTIVFTSDGSNISVNTKAYSITEGDLAGKN
jgi:competence protein ComEC